jgi:hypothetical protein
MDPTTIVSIGSLILSLTGLLVAVLTHIEHSECTRTGGCFFNTVQDIPQPANPVHIHVNNDRGTEVV